MDDSKNRVDWTPDPSFTVETPRLIISHFLPDSDEHCQCVVDVIAHFMSTLDLGTLPAASVDTIEKARNLINTRTKHIHAMDGYGPYLVCEKTDNGSAPKPVGTVSLIRSRPECPLESLFPIPDIGFSLTASGVGKGYAAEAARALLAHAREHWGVTAVAGTTPPANGASRHILEGLGLEYRGAGELRMFPGAQMLVYASHDAPDLEEYFVAKGTTA